MRNISVSQYLLTPRHRDSLTIHGMAPFSKAGGDLVERTLLMDHLQVMMFVVFVFQGHAMKIFLYRP